MRPVGVILANVWLVAFILKPYEPVLLFGAAAWLVVALTRRKPREATMLRRRDDVARVVEFAPRPHTCRAAPDRVCQACEDQRSPL